MLKTAIAAASLTAADVNCTLEYGCPPLRIAIACGSFSPPTSR
jgi:hypothetical protein